MMRPKHLPDFTNPPLDEVVLGVQFSHITGYSAVDAFGVWSLFKKDFPKIVEQPLLEPQFETFGGANLQPSFNFQVGPGSMGTRLWFVSEQENHLLQFQPDRFLSNWRKGGNLVPYPRYETISVAYEKDLNTLSEYSLASHSSALEVNQAEISYINIVPVNEFSEAKEWFSIFTADGVDFEGLNINFNEVVRNDAGEPFARLSHSIQSVFALDGQHKAFSLSITFRGRPEGTDTSAAMRFLHNGRSKIVSRFGELTTTKAHEIWGRKS